MEFEKHNISFLSMMDRTERKIEEQTEGRRDRQLLLMIDYAAITRSNLDHWVDKLREGVRIRLVFTGVPGADPCCH